LIDNTEKLLQPIKASNLQLLSSEERTELQGFIDFVSQLSPAFLDKAELTKDISILKSKQQYLSELPQRITLMQMKMQQVKSNLSERLQHLIEETNKLVLSIPTNGIQLLAHEEQIELQNFISFINDFNIADLDESLLNKNIEHIKTKQDYILALPQKIAALMAEKIKTDETAIKIEEKVEEQKNKEITAIQQEAAKHTKEIAATIAIADNLCTEGNALCYQYKYVEAKECFTKALSLQSDNSYYLYNNGFALFCQKLFIEALNEFEKALVIDPVFVFALQGKAAAFFYFEKPIDAFALLQQVDLLEQTLPNDKRTELWCKYGDMLLTIDRRQFAKEAFEKALSISSGFPYAEMRLKKINSYLFERSWHFDATVKEKLILDKTKEYELIPASPADIRKVITFYQHHPVPGKDIGRIEIIYNSNMNRMFVGELQLLQQRLHQKNEDGKEIFAPTWDQETDPQWRKTIANLYHEMSSFYIDPDYPDVKLLPLWHGTNPDFLKSLFQAGYANLATTDKGFFGKGIYSTHEAEYADRVYSKGALILNWVASFSAYPTIFTDKDKLIGGANYRNYDAHFVPVVPKHQDNPNEVVYYPTHPNQAYKYIEMVVFNPSQCMPRYLVTLQKDLTKSIVSSCPYSFFNAHAITSPATTINLTEATQHVYQHYLSKPYTLKTSTMDWEYSYGGTTIQRPNHGLAHTMRTVSYVPYVVQYYLEHNEDKISPENKAILQANIPYIQLALLFFVVGRENDIGSHEDAVAYRRFRESSAAAFEAFVRDKPLNDEQRRIYKEAISTDSGLQVGKTICNILRICHDLDTMRCLGADIYKLVCASMYPYIGKSNCDKLVNLVFNCLIKTGDRIHGEMPQQAYNGILFIKASQDFGQCAEFINQGIAQWEYDHYCKIGGVALI
jgi:tetratricopeptide (TPR) repeat protein